MPFEWLLFSEGFAAGRKSHLEMFLFAGEVFLRSGFLQTGVSHRKCHTDGADRQRMCHLETFSLKRPPLHGQSFEGI